MISAERIHHRGKDQIKLVFGFDYDIKSKVKTIEGSAWSKTHGAWLVPETVENIEKLKVLFSDLILPRIKRNIGEENPVGMKQEIELIFDKTYYSLRGLVRIKYSYSKIRIKCPKNENDIQFFNSIKYCFWRPEGYYWEMPNSEDNYEMVKIYFGDRIYSIEEEKSLARDNNTRMAQVALNLKEKIIEDEGLKQIEDLVLKFRKWMEHKRYSESTIGSYTEIVRIFLKFVFPKEAREVDAEDMVRFVNEYIIPNHLSYSYQNQAVNGAKLFFKEVIKSKLEVEKLERPRREHKLPNVLSKEEVKAILNSLTNIKHKSMLSLIYACGLRRRELLNLKPKDIDSKRHLLYIINSKGKRDRVVPISDKLIEMLREYYKKYKPQTWLFEGQNTGEQYSEESLAKVLKKALPLCSISKPVTLHWLRHSYATHLLESGTDLRYIQEMLGHKSSKTTEIYTHVSQKSIQQIRSPFDDL